MASSCYVFRLRLCAFIVPPSCCVAPQYTLFYLNAARFVQGYRLWNIRFSLVSCPPPHLKRAFSSCCSCPKHLQFWKSLGVWRRVAWYLPGWIRQLSRKLCYPFTKAHVRNLYGDRCENSKFHSSGIHTARETKFSSLIQTNEILLCHWSWTSFSYEYIQRTRHFGDWLFHPRVKVYSVGPQI